MKATLLALLASVFAGVGGAADFRVAGAVVNAVTSQPVAGARLTLISTTRSDLRVSTISGDDGHFAFAGLPQGRYWLSGERRGLLPGGRPEALRIDAATDNGSLILGLHPPAAISGRIIDDAGEPVAQAQVELITSRGVFASQQTSDTGAYRFGMLPPGSYYLAVSGSPWYSKLSESLGDSAPSSMTHVGHGIRYYPDVADPMRAEPLVLEDGQEVTANFTLLPVPAVSVQVQCGQFEDLTKRYSLTAVGLAGSAVKVREGAATGDSYRFWGVPPGHYVLRAEAADAGRTWFGTGDLEVGAEDTEVSVSLREAPSLKGTVTLEPSVSAPVPALILRDETGDIRTLAVGPEGRFSIAVIPPGRYHLALETDDRAYIKAWSVEGGQRENDLLLIWPGASVLVRLSIGTTE